MLISSSSRSLPLRALLSIGFVLVFFLLLLHPPTRSYSSRIVNSLSKSVPERARNSFSNPKKGLEILPLDPSIPDNALPANRTLGFGAIAVVSGPGPSERKENLAQAADVTGIDLVIPQQPRSEEEEIERFRRTGRKARPGQDENGQGKPMGRGSALAWMGHRNTLKWFLDNPNLESILILEDDVDWDIRLKSRQVPLAASALRSILSSKSSLNVQDQYWGNSRDWDLLYLGHCGDYFGSPSVSDITSKNPTDLTSLAHTVYHDESVPLEYNLHPLTATLFGTFGVPEQSRIVHPSNYPLCTFGYAVTRTGAQKLLNTIAIPGSETAKDARAYDVVILNACRGGNQYQADLKIPDRTDNDEERQKEIDGNLNALRCFTVSPELMHHRPGMSLIAKVEESRSGKEVHRPPVDVAADEVIARTGETANIDCGFWSGDFASEEQGGKYPLEFLKEEVGRKGRCLKEGRDEA